MFAVGDKVRVQAYVPYTATVMRVGRPSTWYPGGATEIMVKPDDARPAREVSSRDLTLIRSTPTFSADMVGRTGTTNHGERVVIVGPAKDPARVTVRPEGGDPSVVETFTPMVSNVTMDPIGSPLCVACGEETDGYASLPTNGGRIHVRCNDDANALSVAQDARPDLDLVAILPRTAEDGPYMRTFRTRDGQTAMLRAESGYAGILALFAALVWAAIMLALWTVTSDAIAGSACAMVPLVLRPKRFAPWIDRDDERRLRAYVSEREHPTVVRMMDAEDLAVYVQESENRDPLQWLVAERMAEIEARQAENHPAPYATPENYRLSCLLQEECSEHGSPWIAPPGRLVAFRGDNPVEVSIDDDETVYVTFLDGAPDEVYAEDRCESCAAQWDYADERWGVYHGKLRSPWLCPSCLSNDSECERLGDRPVHALILPARGIWAALLRAGLRDPGRVSVYASRADYLESLDLDPVHVP